ncbi:MAG: hypothetical protein NVSMB6_16990 [Burkholderiaceae bacterium]
MADIIAARFIEQEQATQASDALVGAGVAQDQISCFYLNPPGQHNLYSIGGDREDSPGAHETGAGLTTGAATGGVIGAAAGLTGVPVFGPIGPAVGALVGAHIGGLFGSLSQTKERGEGEASTEVADGGDNELLQRTSGMLLAVATDHTDREEIIRLLRMFGGRDLEQAQGTIVAGNWEDFDPLEPPRRLDASPGAGRQVAEDTAVVTDTGPIGAPRH